MTFFLFFMNFTVLSLVKIKKNTSHAQNVVKLVLHVAYIILNISAKDLIKIKNFIFQPLGCPTAAQVCPVAARRC